MSHAHWRDATPVVLDTRVVTSTGGGPDKTILNSPRFLKSMGYRNLCAYMHPPNDPGYEQLKQKAAAKDAPLFSVPDRGPLDHHVVSAMLSLCKRERVAIWHGHDYKSNALGLLLRPLWPMKLVSTVHGWGKLGPRTKLYYSVDRVALRYYHSVICVSPDLKAQCIAAGVSEARCTLIENAIDTDEYQRTMPAADAKRAAGVPASRVLLGAVGRISPEKGFDHLVHAVAKLIERGHDIGLWIVGGGEEMDNLRRLVEALGLSDRVRLLGFRADPIQFYEAMDIYVLSSVREGLPNVVLEAMSMEVPVVATRIAGVPRLIASGENGLLVEPGSVDELVAGIEKMVIDHGMRTRLASAGRDTILKRYGFVERMTRVRRIYDDLLGRR